MGFKEKMERKRLLMKEQFQSEVEEFDRLFFNSFEAAARKDSVNLSPTLLEQVATYLQGKLIVGDNYQIFAGTKADTKENTFLSTAGIVVGFLHLVSVYYPNRAEEIGIKTELLRDFIVAWPLFKQQLAAIS